MVDVKGRVPHKNLAFLQESRSEHRKTVRSREKEKDETDLKFVWNHHLGQSILLCCEKQDKPTDRSISLSFFLSFFQKLERGGKQTKGDLRKGRGNVALKDATLCEDVHVLKEQTYLVCTTLFLFCELINHPLVFEGLDQLADRRFFCDLACSTGRRRRR